MAARPYPIAKEYVPDPTLPTGISFPPILERHRWGRDPTMTQKPGGKPLSEQTVRDLQGALGGNFHVLQAELGIEPGAGGSTSPRGRPEPAAQQPDKQIYNAIWGKASLPQMNVFEYAKQKGHALPPNSMPAPQIDSLSSWFAEYGKPKLTQPGVQSEFVSSMKSIPRGHGEVSADMRMIKGSLLR